MGVTLQEIVNLPQLNALKLINRSAGLKNEVTGCGILDYEFEESVRHRFIKVNFSPGQLVLTSFLYAKDNEHLIMDAIKNLIAKGCSGLIIKNIYKLNISSNAIKYADMNNFPIFILKDQDILFENLIVSVAEVIKHYSSKSYYQEKITELMNCENDRTCIKQKTIEINPLFEPDFMVLYFRFKDDFKEVKHFYEIDDIIKPNVSDCIIPYKNGYLFIHTKERFKEYEINKILEPFDAKINTLIENFYISCSDIHHDILELRDAINEAIYATILIDDEDSLSYHSYESIGTYKLILPFIEAPIFRNYSMYYLKPILDFDTEFEGKFFDTLVAYVNVNGDIDHCAKKLAVHKNTIRYRLEKISNLLDENILTKEGYEKVVVAVRIYIVEKKRVKAGF